MSISNLEIVSDRRRFGDIARDLSTLFLGGLDVELVPVGTFQALLRAHIVRALAVQHPETTPTAILAGLGATVGREVDDAEAQTLIEFRLPEELDPRPIVSVPDVAGVAWHLASIRVPAAWSLLGGPDAIDWKSTVVGQIDTGYRPVPVLGFGSAGGTWIETAKCRNLRGLPSGNNGNPPPVEPTDGTDPMFGGPNDGHGSRMGATISGFAPGADGGSDYFGAAPKVPHVVVRISDSVIIGDQQPALAQAIDYLVGDVGVSVINLSMGFWPNTPIKALRKAINRAYERGVILVCAAGNHIDPVVSPAFERRTIAVGGVTKDDLVWSGSSFGETVDWAAPASQVRHVQIDKQGRQQGFVDGGDGTSYATALTTATAALWLTHRAAGLATYPEPWQRVAAFRKLGRNTARRPTLWKSGVVGDGILDARALLDAPLPAAADLKAEDPA